MGQGVGMGQGGGMGQGVGMGQYGSGCGYGSGSESRWTFPKTYFLPAYRTSTVASLHKGAPCPGRVYFQDESTLIVHHMSPGHCHCAGMASAGHCHSSLGRCFDLLDLKPIYTLSTHGWTLSTYENEQAMLR